MYEQSGGECYWYRLSEWRLCTDLYLCMSLQMVKSISLSLKLMDGSMFSVCSFWFMYNGFVAVIALFYETLGFLFIFHFASRTIYFNINKTHAVLKKIQDLLKRKYWNHTNWCWGGGVDKCYEKKCSLFKNLCLVVPCSFNKR